MSQYCLLTVCLLVAHTVTMTTNTEYETVIDPPTVAIAYTDDGTVYDTLWSWEAGVNYSNMGYSVKATAADGGVSVEQAQGWYDAERALAADCFGMVGVR